VLALRRMENPAPTSPELQAAATSAPGGDAASRIAGTFRALGNRNFQLFFSGQIVSLVGTWMQNVAEAWLLYGLTHSAALLGVLGFVAQIPIFLLSPLAGLAADRWPRRPRGVRQVRRS